MWSKSSCDLNTEISKAEQKYMLVKVYDIQVVDTCKYTLQIYDLHFEWNKAKQNNKTSKLSKNVDFKFSAGAAVLEIQHIWMQNNFQIFGSNKNKWLQYI